MSHLVWSKQSLLLVSGFAIQPVPETMLSYIRNFTFRFFDPRNHLRENNLCFWDLMGLVKHLTESVFLLHRVSTRVKVQTEPFMPQRSLFADRGPWTRFPANSHSQWDTTQAGSNTHGFSGNHYWYFILFFLSFFLLHLSSALHRLSKSPWDLSKTNICWSRNVLLIPFSETSPSRHS